MTKKTAVSSLVFGVGLFIVALALSLPVLAEDSFGPPANIPTGGPSMGPPANIPQGPSAAQMEAMQRGQEMEAKGAEMQKQGEEKQLKGMKQGAVGMEKALKQFENNFKKLEIKGVVIAETTKEKLSTVRAGIDTIKNAGSVSDLESVDQDALQEKLSSLGDEFGGYQKMQGFKNMLGSMNRGLVSFEKQLAKLTTQGVTLPTSVADDLAKLKAGLQKINDAKTPQELDDTNPDELGDLMTAVNESRPILEMAAKWPRVLKQVDQQLKSFNNQLIKTKTLVDKLNKQGLDVSTDFATFQADVVALQTARDAANSLMKEGKSEESFTLIEDEFFNKLDNAGEQQRVIQNLANLGRFNTEFKRGMVDAQKSIKALAKRKIDTAGLQAIYDQALAKGNEILVLLKVKPLDEEAVASAMDTLENLKQQFFDKADELGGGAKMPWEDKTPAQFKDLALPKDFDKTVSQITTVAPKLP